MALIEEIKAAEAQAAKMRQEAERKGRELVEEINRASAEHYARLIKSTDAAMADETARARQIIDQTRKEYQEEYDRVLQNLSDSVQKHRDQAVKKVQHSLLKWPSSR